MLEIKGVHPQARGIHIGLTIAIVLLLIFFLAGHMGQVTVPPGWLSWASFQRYAQAENQNGISWSTRSAYSN